MLFCCPLAGPAPPLPCHPTPPHPPTQTQPSRPSTTSCPLHPCPAFCGSVSSHTVSPLLLPFPPSLLISWCTGFLPARRKPPPTLGPGWPLGCVLPTAVLHSPQQALHSSGRFYGRYCASFSSPALAGQRAAVWAATCTATRGGPHPRPCCVCISWLVNHTHNTCKPPNLGAPGAPKCKPAHVGWLQQSRGLGAASATASIAAAASSGAAAAVIQ